MDKFDMFLGLLALILIIWGIVYSIIATMEKDEACNKLGFEDYTYWSGEPVCEDDSGDLYFVKLECNSFHNLWITDCKASLISVGNVRGIIN